MFRSKIQSNNQFNAKLVILYFLLLPIYLILQLKIGIKAHFIIPVIYLVILIKNYRRLNFYFFKYIILFYIIQLPYSIYQYYNYLYNWFGLMYLLFICSLPWFIVGSSLTNLEELLIQFKKNVFYIVISNALLIIFCKMSGRTMLGNMEISYTILPLVLFPLLIFFKEKNIKFLLLSFFSAVVILIVGSRGTLLCIACFYILYYLLNFKKEIFHILLIGIVFLGICMNYQLLLKFAINKLEYYGISSRTLYKLQNGDLLNDTGRGKIQKAVIEALKDKPILGLGLGGERIIVNDKIYNMNKEMSSCYPHNILIEIISQYGYCLGTIVIALLMYIIIKALKKTRGNERNIILLLISQEFIKLFISSSYIMSPMFFLMLGICCSKIGGKVNE